jgi:DNA-binding MarR family transcriptional regulator
MDIELTDRGRAAAVVIRAAIEKVDQRLTATLSATELAGLRTGLGALAAINRETHSDREPKDV